METFLCGSSEKIAKFAQIRTHKKFVPRGSVFRGISVMITYRFVSYPACKWCYNGICGSIYKKYHAYLSSILVHRLAQRINENENWLKGVFHGSAHVQAYQLYPSKKTHSHVLLDTSVITYYNY